jgi:SAM-dependent methyltransferase
MPYRGGYENSAHLYDLFDTKENIEFFHRFAKEAREILDVGAGTGRIAIPLAERGIQVCCVEPSPAMRREFLKKLKDRSDLTERIRLIEGDAAGFDFGRTFQAAFLSGSFDHLLDDGARRMSLGNLSRHLIPGGTLVFDVFLGLMGDSELRPAGSVVQGDVEHRRFVGGKTQPDGTKETILVFETYRKDEIVNRIEERSLVGIVDRPKVHLLLRESGFEIRREFRDYQSRPYRDGDELLLVEAKKS